jgi:rhodanese-related sulfurtransferase
VRVEDLLDEARAGLRRLGPRETWQAMQADEVIVVDIREQVALARDGCVPGAIPIPRNVLEWRAAPQSQWRDDRISDPDRVLVLMCNEGYQSSLAAATLQRLGLPNATDMTGGFKAWLAEGLPVDRPSGARPE